MLRGFNGVTSRTGKTGRQSKRHGGAGRLLRSCCELMEMRTLLSGGAPFTIAALPDTQNYVKYYPHVFESQTQWIADHAASDNIAFATHFGDLVTRGYRDWHMDNADAAMDNLDGFVPYSVSMGNHDYEGYYEDIESHGTSANFAKYFGSARYAGYGWYGGSSIDQRSHFQVFEADGRQFLHINLEWEAPDSAIAWAQGVINSHRQLPAILTTHSYLTSGGRSTSTLSSDGGNSGEAIFQKLVAPNPQVFLVMSGHVGAEYHQTSTNSFGTSVLELTADYSSRSNGGDGWLQLLRFDPAANRIDVTTYSTWLNQSETDANSQFSFDIDFDQRFALFAAGAPIANDEIFDVQPDLPVSGNVLTNDIDVLAATLVGAPAHGLVEFTPDGAFTYTPDGVFHGSDSFTYTASNATGGSNLATVTIRVNRAPFTADDSADTVEYAPVTINVLANDSDADGDPLKVSLVSLATHGTVVRNADGSFTYTPNPKYTGPDSFTCAATDGVANGNVATVYLNVTPSVATFAYATAESGTYGIVTNDRTAMTNSDGVTESITEVASSGTSRLDRKWTFNVAGGEVTFAINAWCSVGEKFQFDYSTNGSTWTRMFDVSRPQYDPSQPLETFTLPAGIKGTVYIRVFDMTRTAGEGVHTINIDEMFLRSIDTVAPTAPTNLAVTGTTASSVSLAWTASTDNVAVTGYEIYRNGNKVGTSATTTYTDSGLVLGTAYSYYVKAYDASGNISPASNTVTGTPTAPVGPIAPSNLTAVVYQKTRAKLTWLDSATNETGFYVYRSSDGINWTRYATVGRKTGTGTVTYTTSTLAKGTWYFRVTSYNANGESAPSNIKSILI